MRKLIYAGTSGLFGNSKPVGVIKDDGWVYRGGTVILEDEKLIGKSLNGEVFRENGGFLTSFIKIGSYRGGRIYRTKYPGSYEETEVGSYENGIVYQSTGGWGSKREIGRYEGDPAGGAALLLLYDMLV